MSEQALERSYGFLLVILVSIFATCCTIPPSGLVDYSLEEKKSAMRILSNKAQAKVKYQDPEGKCRTEACLIAFLKSSLPEEMIMVRENMLRIRVEGKYTSLLLCSADGSRALVEDTDCAIGIGANSNAGGQEAITTDRPCQFTVDFQTACRSAPTDIIAPNND